MAKIILKGLSNSINVSEDINKVIEILNNATKSEMISIRLNEVSHPELPTKSISIVITEIVLIRE